MRRLGQGGAVYTDRSVRHEQIIRRVAGSLVLVSTLAARFVHPDWIWLAVFVGANLFQSSFTGICPLENILQQIDRKRGRVSA
jgi:hypothetical protein